MGEKTINKVVTNAIRNREGYFRLIQGRTREIDDYLGKEKKNKISGLYKREILTEKMKWKISLSNGK